MRNLSNKSWSETWLDIQLQMSLFRLYSLWGLQPWKSGTELSWHGLIVIRISYAMENTDCHFKPFCALAEMQVYIKFEMLCSPSACGMWSSRLGYKRTYSADEESSKKSFLTFMPWLANATWASTWIFNIHSTPRYIVTQLSLRN